jgi:spore cortex biosynthesis protein YabQ
MPVLDQVIVFSLVVIWGALGGLIFDFYRMIRRIWRPGRWGTSLGDIGFWLLLTGFTAAFLLLITWGEVRVYVFLAMSIGVGIYFLLKRLVKSFR